MQFLPVAENEADHEAAVRPTRLQVGPRLGVAPGGVLGIASLDAQAAFWLLYGSFQEVISKRRPVSVRQAANGFDGFSSRPDKRRAGGEC